MVRQVVIPGINDTDAYMERLKNYIETNLPTATRVELLPYHRLGAHKYEAMGIAEPLGDTPPCEKAVTEALLKKHFPHMT